ncbi:hypothetical protein DH2020_013770 [Rehmannia glutinosa]|uniref:Uncharacterized protein n=1 Tax=Rehmannia glutinosa TaxID=99300 RepID=A0ABR0X3B8_REHGL
MAESEINFENGAQETAWSGDEFERVPLKQRLKLLLASHRMSVDSDLKSESQIPVIPPWVTDSSAFLNLGAVVAEKRENGHCDSQFGCSAEEQMIETLRKEERHAGNRSWISLQESLFVKSPVTVKVECADNHFENSSANCMNGSYLAGTQAAVNFEPEMSDEYRDDLEHVVLKERLRRLLTRTTLEKLHLLVLAFQGFLCSDFFLFDSLVAGTVRGEQQFGDEQHVVSGKQIHEIDRILKSGTSKDTLNSSCKPHQALDHCSRGYKSTYADSLGIQRNDMICSSEKECSKYESDGKKTLLSGNTRTLQGSAVSILANIKIEPPCYNEFQTSRPVASKPAQAFKVNRPRKRRKTVTDSVETAMEEDAPGLLKVLVENGVSVDEIKLYGEPESDDALEDSSTKDNFAELEEVITKLFSQRESLLKFGPLRCAKGEKASYCLECLFSLVEQARYLRFRNWPVEWGWCRDLQSFIFVFERHNRIVLERPEYGYATYFFELADSLPIDWQIKRLVTAMKLTSCSRITIIENRELMVGDDLTEGEARVLMDYGWIPNTGLGTMLNYYDRVVHDRRNERDRSEWKSKIGKLLMDGYNGGTIISSGIPKKAMESDVTHPVEIKLEFN